LPDLEERSVLHVVLVEPEIPPNTGNVIRLCANTGAHLHLVQPLGFTMDDARLRRAGLDYHEWARVLVHPNLDEALAGADPARCFAFSTRGARSAYDVRFAAGDRLVFGAETRGLADAVVARFLPGNVLRLPMRPGNRSINLSNAVAISVFEAWRQLGFDGGQ
jgi:tRNA (cytidine/uridine-2'-O-)-methyltransferase